MTFPFRACSAPTCVLLALLALGCSGGSDSGDEHGSGDSHDHDSGEHDEGGADHDGGGDHDEGGGEHDGGEGDHDDGEGEHDEGTSDDGDAGHENGAGDHADGDGEHGDGPETAAGGATLSGRVTMTGDIPAKVTKRVDLSGFPGCAVLLEGADLYPNSLIKSDDGGLANCFIYVDGPWEMDPPDEPAKIDQIKCRYTPKVLGIMCGQDLEIWNSDEENHNVHILPRANEEDNIGMPVPDKKVRSFPLKESVPITFKCDLHPWMKAFVGVLPHPYFAVSDENGEYSIAGVPPGEWTVVVWHELKGFQKHAVTFVEGEAATLDDCFEF